MGLHDFLLILFVLKTGTCQNQQYFIEKPDSILEAVEHSSAVLKCKVGNQAGQVQWTKDGFALGFNRSLPGYATYKLEGDADKGEHHLRISNVSLEDDAVYQCQVGPSKAQGHQQILAEGKLVVLLPPLTIQITGRSDGESIDIPENTPVYLECIVTNAKPAATIKWYKNSQEVFFALCPAWKKAIPVATGQKTNVCVANDRYEPSATETKEGTLPKRQNTRSRITVIPRASDDKSTYTCTAYHPALPSAMSSSVVLNVFYPPGAPEIIGYSDGEIIKINESVTLTCRSRGGNPLAQLIWSKNGKQIDFSYSTSGKMSTNSYTFKADVSDDNATYRCEASNKMTSSALEAAVRLSVRFGPAKLTIIGDRKARMGQRVTLSCTTSVSNPAAKVIWIVDGKAAEDNNSSFVHTSTVLSQEGGWITVSNITHTIEPVERNVMFSCHAYNEIIGKTIIQSHSVSVIYPPSAPYLTGYTSNKPLVAGSVIHLLCNSDRGNPLATLKWFKGRRELTSLRTESGDRATAEIKITVDSSDNGEEYRCEASNEALVNPLIVRTSLKVYFPPRYVKVKIKPKKLKVGERATLSCESRSSNPEATLTWWRQGFLISGGEVQISPSSDGGKSSRSILYVTVNSTDHEAVYTCQATNEELSQSIHDAITLEVSFKPEFVGGHPDRMDVAEGEPVVLNFTARSNPAIATYLWTRNGANLARSYAPRANNALISIDGPVLKIAVINRNDTGTYKLEVTNTEGTSYKSVYINVRYPPVVTEISSPVVITARTNAFLECSVDANPLADTTISWMREGYPMENKTRTSYNNGKLYLTVFNVSREDTGIFTCVANNGVGQATNRTALLIVKFKPEIDRSSPYSKAASENGGTALLVCKAAGAPNVTFSWSREGALLDTKSNGKYESEERPVGFTTWEGRLLVKNVGAADYGGYDCIARNELGFTTHCVMLNVTSAPDAPKSLRVLNTTHDAVALQWTPGFNGGLAQYFRIRYRPVGETAYKYVDVPTAEENAYVVGDLKLGTEYTLAVMAFNEKGQSAFSNGMTKAKTAMSERESSKSATMEMYVASTYNETVTGETVSSVSEKTENYSHEESVDYGDEVAKKATSTYLVDNLDPPSYTGFRQNEMYASRTLPFPCGRTPYGERDGSRHYAETLRSVAAAAVVAQQQHQPSGESPAARGVATPRSGRDFHTYQSDAPYSPYPSQKLLPPLPSQTGPLNHLHHHHHHHHHLRNGTVPNGCLNRPQIVSPSPALPPAVPVFSTFNNSNVPHDVSPAEELEGHLV